MTDKPPKKVNTTSPDLNAERLAQLRRDMTILGKIHARAVEFG